MGIIRIQLVSAFLVQKVMGEPSCLNCKWPTNSWNMLPHLSQGLHLYPCHINMKVFNMTHQTIIGQQSFTTMESQGIEAFHDC